MKMQKTEEEWKKQLTPQQFEILRSKGTEPAFTGEFVDKHDDGIYHCAACGNPLFSSEAKFESGSGWPSFYDIATKGNVILQDDNSHGMSRTEVVCANCGGHLGHLFNDGPKEKTGLRYCINSCALNFKDRTSAEASADKEK
ncbi:MAG: peptide-methionine (R)-S-oxide reductase MsrB [Candidatus Levybacteria bacterium]|nr:peptide-methionine (R)-S-oxide reductase MsrB [Candidatus Levybacteria bacterium]